MKRLWCHVGLVGLIGCVWLMTFSNWIAPMLTSWRPKPPWRTQDELFTVPRSLGWTVVRPPQVGKMYRIIGAIADEVPNSPQTVIEGAFRHADGRTVKFKIPKPVGAGIEVQGLEPDDRGPLQYAVLSRPQDSKVP
jgi:hypothetical protein